MHGNKRKKHGYRGGGQNMEWCEEVGKKTGGGGNGEGSRRARRGLKKNSMRRGKSRPHFKIEGGEGINRLGGGKGGVKKWMRRYSLGQRA